MTWRSLSAAVPAVVALGACGGSDERGPKPAAQELEHAAIAFVRFEGSKEDRFGDIYTMRADGSEQTNLTKTSAVGEEAPAWSPDGTQIAFVRETGRFSDVYTMNADGTGRRNITRTRRITEDAPAWSPDGTRIAFVRRKGRFSDVYTTNVDGADEANVTHSRRIREEHPAWSPDAARIVVHAEWPRKSDPSTADGGLHVVEADGSGRRALTRGAASADLYVASPTFAPDGQTIAFLGLRARARHWVVWIMKADGSHPRPLANRPRSAHARGPTFSSDGKRIAFEGVRDGPGIYVMNADGSRQRRLPGGRLNDQGPAWSPAAP